MPPRGSFAFRSSRLRARRVRNIPPHRSFEDELSDLFQGSVQAGRDVDIQRGLLKATRARDNGRILRYLTAGSGSPDFVRAIPATTFTEILRLFSPDRELDPVVDGVWHTWWLPDHLQHLREKVYQTAYARQLADLVNLRIDAGVSPSPVDLRLVALGAGKAAEIDVVDYAIRKLRASGRVPDVDFFNSSMRAFLFNRRGRNGDLQLGFRVTNLWFKARKLSKMKWAPPPLDYVLRVQTTYKAMLDSGGVANQETVICLMTAFAREGRMHDVNKLLSAVWLVDVEAVSSGRPTSPPKQYPAGSPLRPTEDLLLAVCQAYGLNDRSMTALALVDYLSSSYGIPISDRVWRLLIVHVYAESKPPHGSRYQRELHDRVGLNHEVVLRLYKTIRKPPFNVKPTIVMLWFFIKRACRHIRWIRTADLIRDAARLYDASAVEASHAAHEVREAKRRVAEGGVSPVPIFELAQRREIKLLEFRRNRVIMESACHMFIKSGFIAGSFQAIDEEDKAACNDPLGYEVQDPKGDFIMQPLYTFVGLPNFIKEFTHLLPPAVSYRTPTGLIRLEVHQHAEVRERPSKPGQTHNIRAFNEHMTRRIADRYSFSQELGEYERLLTGSAYNRRNLERWHTHLEDPPDLLLETMTA